jgi:hypothetical protein
MLLALVALQYEWLVYIGVQDNLHRDTAAGSITDTVLSCLHSLRSTLSSRGQARVAFSLIVSGGSGSFTVSLVLRFKQINISRLGGSPVRSQVRLISLYTLHSPDCETPALHTPRVP